jgi:hypothetical protein
MFGPRVLPLAAPLMGFRRINQDHKPKVITCLRLLLAAGADPSLVIPGDSLGFDHSPLMYSMDAYDVANIHLMNNIR